MELTAEQITFIRENIRKKGITMDDLTESLVASIILVPGIILLNFGFTIYGFPFPSSVLF